MVMGRLTEGLGVKWPAWLWGVGVEWYISMAMVNAPFLANTCPLHFSIKLFSEVQKDFLPLPEFVYISRLSWPGL